MSEERGNAALDATTKSALAINEKAAGAGVVGLLGFAGLLVVSGVFFVTENFFIALLGVSLGLLVYATGAEIGKLLLSAVTVFFSSKHITAKATMLQETLVALEDGLALRRDRAGELKTGPMEKGMRIELPDNALVRDLVAVQEKQKDYEYAEYVAYSYYVECQELYDHSAAHLDFVAGTMPLLGLMGTVLGLISMFDSLGSVVTVEQLSPQLALALKCTLYGALYSSLYKISATRFEQRLKSLDYDFDTVCRALKVIFDNKAAIEVKQ
ncbi:MAG: MotA/TolQ/ExbB proton channel family protein [Deltaproteobacteria bacterium]|nr:MotA/TolQ/ExbB proton channel family protein [Deltaproteobacteria bacterium]